MHDIASLVASLVEFVGFAGVARSLTTNIARVIVNIFVIWPRLTQINQRDRKSQRNSLSTLQVQPKCFEQK